MTNTYFNHTSPLARFTTADAARLNATLKAVEAGFDKLPTAQELQQGSRNYSVATNIGNAYSVTVPFVLSGYSQGLEVTFFAGVANTSTATLNVNSLGPVTIKRFNNANLLPSDIQATSINTVIYDGSSFRLVSMHGGSEALASTSATNAANSATSAATSASQALASKTAASVSEANALSSATTASAALSGTRFGLRNLLLNPVFWVDQRNPGVFSGTALTGVFIRDRWKAGASGATWSIATQVMTLTAGSVVQVVLGRNIHLTGFYTLSWTGTATARINGTVVDNGGHLSLPAYTNATVEFFGGSFSYPQLEYGTIKTPFELRPTDLERAICQQYYQKSYADGTAPGTATYTGARHGTILTAINTDSNTVQFYTPMRGNPFVSILNPQGYAGSFRNIDANIDHGYTISFLNDRSFTFFSAAADMTTGQRVYYHWTADAEI